MYSGRLPSLVSFALPLMLAAVLPSRAADAPPAVEAALERACAACHAAAVRETWKSAGRDGGWATHVADILVSRHSGRDDVKAHWPVWPTPDEITGLVRWLDAAERAPAPGAAASGATAERTFSITPDKPAYLPGEPVHLVISAPDACYATLVLIDRDGQAVVLLPNAFETDNKVLAGQPRVLPGASGYRFKAHLPGEETVIGWCTADPARLAGVRLPYDLQLFPILGRWPTALARMIGESEEIEGVPASERRAGRTTLAAEGQTLFHPHGYAAVRIRTAEPTSEQASAPR